MKFLVVLLGLSLCFAYADALKCYNCLTGGNDCTTELECPTGTDACLKSFASSGSVSASAKMCGLAASAKDCDSETAGICSCTADLCNGAESVQAASGLAFALVAALVAKYLN